jgi:hypothetical protein
MSPLLSNNELFFSHVNFILQRGGVVVVVVVVVVVEVEVFVVVCVTVVELAVVVAEVVVEIALVVISTVEVGVVGDVGLTVVVDATRLAVDATTVEVGSGVV